MSVRTGNTLPLASAWAPIASPGTSIGTTGQYLQYQAVMSTTNTALTPVLRRVEIGYNTVPDNEPPTIQGRTPAPGATNVAANSPVVVQFSETMNPATLSTATFGLRVTGAPADLAATVTPVGATATLTPSSALTLGTEYTVTVLGTVADLAGNELGSPDSWTFTTVAPDVTPPVLSNVTALPDPGGTTATVQWLTNEPATSVVQYGTDPLLAGATTLSDSTLLTSHSMALTGLLANTTYHYQVTSVDGSANSNSSLILSFDTPSASYTDTTVTDFTAGTLEAGTAVLQTDDGEVALAGSAGSSEFFTFPTNWTSFLWDGSGSATVQAGQLVVDAARASTQLGVTSGPGASVEFRATFGAASFQNAGFGGGNDSANGMFNDLPWAVFGTPSGSTKLHARVWASGGSSVDVDLDPGNALNLIGTPHTYRIDWTVVRVRVLRGRHQPPHREHPDRRGHARRRE